MIKVSKIYQLTMSKRDDISSDLFFNHDDVSKVEIMLLQQ